jgi:hypothetical protein
VSDLRLVWLVAKGRNGNGGATMGSAALLGFILSSTVFVVLAFLTATTRYLRASNLIVQEFYRVFPIGHAVFGIAGLVSFCSSSACLTIYLGRESFWRVIQFFTIPLFMFYEVWILVADEGEMPKHIVMFIAGTPLSGILTNWVGLFVSAGLFAFALARRLHNGPSEGDHGAK